MEALIGSFKRFLSEIIKLSYKKWTWACDHLKTINLSAENLKNSSPQWVGKYKFFGRFCERTRLSTPQTLVFMKTAGHVLLCHSPMSCAPEPAIQSADTLFWQLLICFYMDVHRLYCTSCDISHPLTRGSTVVRTDKPTEGVILSEPKFLGCINIKTESVRKLSNFNFQWTKTLYQNYLKRIAFFFSFFKG